MLGTQYMFEGQSLVVLQSFQILAKNKIFIRLNVNVGDRRLKTSFSRRKLSKYSKNKHKQSNKLRLHETDIEETYYSSFTYKKLLAITWTQAKTITFQNTN